MTFRKLIAAILFSGIPVSLAFPAEPVTLFKDNKSFAYLDIPAADQIPLKPAIDDFKRCFERMTGAGLPQAPSENPISIQIKRLPPGNTGSSYEDGLGAGDCTIHVTSKSVVIEGSTDLALENGFYSLLDEWGCRWFLPGNIGEVIPTPKSIVLMTGVRNIHISADSRILAGPDAYFPPNIRDWIRRNRFEKERTVTAHHHWLGVVPPSVYLKSHPEYFALVGGMRKPTQICTTNPNVIYLAVNGADDYFAKHADFDTYPLSPEDNVDFCECPDCAALDPKTKTPQGWTPLSDRVMTFANAVACGIRDKHPGKLVGILAYLNYTYPPEKVKPEPEIMVVVTRSIFDLLHLTPRKNGDSASQFYKLVADWKKLTPHVYTYEYNPIFWVGDLPCPNYMDYGQTTRDLLKIGSLGQRSDPGELPFRNANDFVNDYMAIRISVDSELSPEDILSDMCEKYFAEAAPQMLHYYKVMSHVTDYQAPDGRIISGGIRDYDKIFTPAMIAEGRSALDEARKAAAGDTTIDQRVQMVDLGHQYLEAYLNGVWAVERADFSAAETCFTQMNQAIEVLTSKGLITNGGFILKFMNGARLMAYTEYAPRKIGMITRWKTLGPINNSERNEEGKTGDSVASITSPLKMDGQIYQWKQYDSKSGFIRLPGAFGAVDAQWNAVYGYLGVNLTTEKETPVQLRMDSFNPYRVYLNGKEIFYRPGRDLDLPDKRSVNVILPSGQSTLVVKCIQTIKDPTIEWGFNMRIIDPQTNEPDNRVVVSTGVK